MRKPASKDRCRLLLQGINPNTSPEMIELYVENMMGLNVSDYTLYPSPGKDFILIHLSRPFSKGVLNAHILFSPKNIRMSLKCLQMFWVISFLQYCLLFCFCFVDFQNLSAKISKRTLDGAKVTLEQIEQTDSILVENLHPGTTPDLLTVYFENKGGGKVKEVTMLSEGTAKVSFVNYDGKFCILYNLLKLFIVSSCSFFNHLRACLSFISCGPCPSTPAQSGRC